MSIKKSYLTATDQFCGAGGSSEGATAAGFEVVMALNHWKLAIETHSTNFPETKHDCTDISACDPRRYPSTNILITSPECTTHSPAGGNTHKALKKQMALFDTGVIDPATERSRATMYDVMRFAEYHNYEAIIVENVVEAMTRWALFDWWLNGMRNLDYNFKLCFLNSMHFHPTPQSRDRMYIVFWKKGNKAPNLDYTPLAYCCKCANNIHSVQTWKKQNKRYGKYKQQYVYKCPSCATTVEPYYYAAFNCIDWSDKGKRIGDRTKPLSDNTLRRIKYGLNKYGKQPYIIQTVNGGEDWHRSKSVMDTSFTHTTLQSQGLVVPFIINDQHRTGLDFRVKSVNENLPTLATTHGLRLVSPPLMVDLSHTKAADASFVRTAFSPTATQATNQDKAFFFPYIVEMNRTGEAKPAEETFATITGGGINHATCLVPLVIENKGKSNARNVMNALPALTTTQSNGILTDDALQSFISNYNNGSHCTNYITEPTGTILASDRAAIVNYQQPVLEDCFYRMLKPNEVKLAMAFSREYVILGNSRDKVKQCGNAVTPPPMAWLCEQVKQSLL